jgi:hypothetical protein
MLILQVERNDYKGYVPNSAMRDINVAPGDALTFTDKDFCNLILPDDYKLHCLGWISKADFLKACQKYPAWVWPIDAKSRFENTPWDQVTDRDRKLLESLGMAGRITRNPSRINVGLLKTSGKGPGACCYVFPNIRGTGVRETNLYVLPHDLNTMISLEKPEGFPVTTAVRSATAEV